MRCLLTLASLVTALVAVSVFSAGCGIGCSKSCDKGKCCGNSCIAKSKTCHKLDDGSEWADPADEPEDAVGDPGSFGVVTSTHALGRRTLPASSAGGTIKPSRADIGIDGLLRAAEPCGPRGDLPSSSFAESG